MSFPSLIPQAYAQITNPAIDATLGADAEAAASGNILINAMGTILTVIGAIGVLLVFLYLILGAFDWITSGGDSSKIASARQKMIQAVIGLILLAASTAIIMVVQAVLGVELIGFGGSDSANTALSRPRSAGQDESQTRWVIATKDNPDAIGGYLNVCVERETPAASNNYATQRECAVRANQMNLDRSSN